MYTIRVRRRQKFYLLSLCFFIFIAYYFLLWVYHSILQLYGWDDFMEGPCNKRLHWMKAGHRGTIGILGAPESGVMWLRFLIEQMSGKYTGSAEDDLGGEPFKGNGKTTEVIGVMAHDLNKISDMVGGIVLYRNLKDTLRAQFAKMKGTGAFLEAPIEAYYGKDWENHVVRSSQEWFDFYLLYLNSGVPLLIMGYEEIHDPNQLRTQLLLISNFLHVPIRASVFECVMEKVHETDSKPKTLKTGFQPFDLLPIHVMTKINALEENVEKQITEAREDYRPKV